MKRRMFLASMVVLALIVFVPCAWSAGVLNMPPNPVGVAHGAWRDASMGGTFVITLSGIPGGYDLSNGKYTGWCAEDNGMHPKVGRLPLYDSTDEALLPPTYQGVEWGKVNWLLNNKQGTPSNIQNALWCLIGANTTIKNCSGIAGDMVNDADANGVGFVPDPGQIVAVLAYSDGYGTSIGQPDEYQDTILEVQVPAGCTLTPGYWKTHSSYGPAPYDDMWAKIGEDTTFYLSGKSWYKVLWTPPKGNAYYILAFQYIAARLNIEAGATTTPDVEHVLSLAESFFSVYTPASTLSKTQKNFYVGLASILDSYNNGYIGPGHCSN
jgi:hypothetical protein